MPCIDGNPKWSAFVYDCFNNNSEYIVLDKCVWILGLFKICILRHIYGHICRFFGRICIFYQNWVLIGKDLTRTTDQNFHKIWTCSSVHQSSLLSREDRWAQKYKMTCLLHIAARITAQIRTNQFVQSQLIYSSEGTLYLHQNAWKSRMRLEGRPSGSGS